MKKLLIISNLFWISVILFWSCSPKFTNFSSKDCQAFCYNYSGKTFGGLAYGAAKKMADLYYQNHYQYIKSGLSAEDSRSVWFDYETIKTFIYQIERSVCKNGCPETTKENLGIRFYFGEYPSHVSTDPLFAGIPEEYSNLHTLFMVPTYFDSNTGKSYDFDPIWNEEYNKGNCAPKAIVGLAKDVNGPIPVTYKTMMTALAPAPEPSGMQNHGGLCPPKNCD